MRSREERRSLHINKRQETFTAAKSKSMSGTRIEADTTGGIYEEKIVEGQKFYVKLEIDRAPSAAAIESRFVNLESGLREGTNNNET